MLPNHAIDFPLEREVMMRQYIDGATSVARGAIAAHCTFFAGYPISPATSILLHMIRELPKVGGVAIQAEDEIASIGLCIGAAMAGARVMTATSGPGISLYSENVGLAIMAEVPIVIVDVMRMGPATGGATTGAQGDVQFVRWGTSGGWPIIALCPSTVSECCSLTIRAFGLAERFRVPVFLVTDKETALTFQMVVEAPASQPAPEADNAESVSHALGKPCDVPPLLPFGGPHITRATTSTHDERGYLTRDPAKVRSLNERLAAKIDACRGEIELVNADLQKGAKTLIVSYGITARSVAEAVGQARAEGRAVSALTVCSLWPVPEVAIARALEGIGRVVVPELNLGQYRREIERLVGSRIEVVGIPGVDGELIPPEEILRHVDTQTVW